MVNFPSVEWVQQSTATDPSGFRNVSNPAKGFIRVLDTTAGGVLDFGQLNTTGSGAITPTKLAYARVTAFADASGIFNMRTFLSNITSWGAGTFRFLERKTLHFVPNLSLTSVANNTPTTVPATTNFLGTIIQPEWTSGKPWISGILDNDVSQYIYLAVEVGVDTPVGTYGGAGAGTFRYRLLYDFS